MKQIISVLFYIDHIAWLPVLFDRLLRSTNLTTHLLDMEMRIIMLVMKMMIVMLNMLMMMVVLLIMMMMVVMLSMKMMVMIAMLIMKMMIVRLMMKMMIAMLIMMMMMVMLIMMLDSCSVAAQYAGGCGLDDMRPRDTRRLYFICQELWL